MQEVTVQRDQNQELHLIMTLIRLIIIFLVFIRIRWTGTSSHPYEKTLSSTVLYPAFSNIKMYNHKSGFNLIIVHSILYPRKAV